LLVIDIKFPAQIVFPHPSLADQADGLLCFSKELNDDIVLFAYLFGVFPWNNNSKEVHWWYTNPRFVLAPNEIHISGNLRKMLKSQRHTVTYDKAFDEVIEACAFSKRKNQRGTWIHDRQMQVFKNLHRKGWAHSVEVWENDVLVGGLYGLRVGKVFFGESMFHKVSGASKIAFVHLCEKLQELHVELIDCQMRTPLLESFGASDISGKSFLSILRKNMFEPAGCSPWS
jgi:leucyl/phenylalanyl-tRNA---protein transferase